jgi:hypothetical protein
MCEKAQVIGRFGETFDSGNDCGIDSCQKKRYFASGNATLLPILLPGIGTSVPFLLIFNS